MLCKRSILKIVSEFTDKHKKQSSKGVLSKKKDVLRNFAKFAENHLFWSLFFNKIAGWKPETFRSNHWRCSVKQGALKNFANFTGNNLRWSLFLIKLYFWCLQLIKEGSDTGAVLWNLQLFWRTSGNVYL